MCMKVWSVSNQCKHVRMCVIACVCVCVCMFVCVHVCVCVYVDTSMHMFAYSV